MTLHQRDCATVLSHFEEKNAITCRNKLQGFRFLSLAWLEAVKIFVFATNMQRAEWTFESMWNVDTNIVNKNAPQISFTIGNRAATKSVEIENY